MVAASVSRSYQGREASTEVYLTESKPGYILSPIWSFPASPGPTGGWPAWCVAVGFSGKQTPRRCLEGRGLIREVGSGRRSRQAATRPTADPSTPRGLWSYIGRSELSLVRAPMAGT